jgi:hypothetical protein
MIRIVVTEVELNKAPKTMIIVEGTRDQIKAMILDLPKMIIKLMMR